MDSTWVGLARLGPANGRARSNAPETGFGPPPGPQNQELFDLFRLNPTNEFASMVERVLPENPQPGERAGVAWDLAVRLLVPGEEEERRWRRALGALPLTGQDQPEDRILQAAAAAALGWHEAAAEPNRLWWGGYYLVAACLDLHARSAIRAVAESDGYLPTALRNRLAHLVRPQPRDTTGRPGTTQYERAQVETWALALGASLVFYWRCGCGLVRGVEQEGPGSCHRADHIVARWRPGEPGEPPTAHAWLARYVRGRLAPPRGAGGAGRHGFSPSGLRYSALYASLLAPDTGLRIDSVLMRHCPSCDRWLTAEERSCPRDSGHPVGWRLRQHWMFDAHEETLRERLVQHRTSLGTLRIGGVGTDGIVVSGRRLHPCGNRGNCCYFVMDPTAPCAVCGTPAPHGTRASVYPPLGPLALDVEPLGMPAPDGNPETEYSELLRACDLVIGDTATRPAFLRCLAQAIRSLLGEPDSGFDIADDDLLRRLSERLPKRTSGEVLAGWVRRLLAHAASRHCGGPTDNGERSDA